MLKTKNHPAVLLPQFYHKTIHKIFLQIETTITIFQVKPTTMKCIISGASGTMMMVSNNSKRRFRADNKVPLISVYSKQNSNVI